MKTCVFIEFSFLFIFFESVLIKQRCKYKIYFLIIQTFRNEFSFEIKNNFLPPVNQRIKELVDSRFNGSVRQFSMAMGIEKYQKINRLFSIDKRSDKFPKPSIDILAAISNTFDVTIAWLQNGDEEKECNEIPKSEKEFVPDVVVPASVWQVVQKQADSLAARDRQIDELLSQCKM